MGVVNIILLCTHPLFWYDDTKICTSQTKQHEIERYQDKIWEVQISFEGDTNLFVFGNEVSKAEYRKKHLIRKGIKAHL